MFASGLIFIMIVAPLQVFVGDMLGLNSFKYQPAKVSAMEGIWEDEKGAALRLFGIPDEEKEETAYAILIPKLSSLILTHHLDGEIKGLKSFAKEEAIKFIDSVTPFVKMISSFFEAFINSFRVFLAFSNSCVALFA